MSLTKKASLNALASSLDYGARLLVGFLINPLLVRGLGDYGYGIWQILGRLIGYITPASGRPTQALQWLVANQQASTDYVEKRRQVASAMAVWVLFLPLLASFGGILTWFAPIWLKTPTSLYSNVRWAAALLVLNLIAISLVEIPKAVLNGENLGYKRMGLSALLVMVGGGLMVLALHLNTGLIGVAAATLTTTLLTGALFWQVAQTYVSWFGIAKPVWKAIRQFLNLSGWFLVWNLVIKLMRGSDVVILGILNSAELVTNYSLNKYVPETLINIIAIVVIAISPGLGGIIGAGNLTKASRIRGEIMLLTWLLVTVAGTAILLWNHSFVRLWVGNDYDLGAVTTLLIVVVVAQFVLIRNDATIINLTLDLRQKVILGFISANISLLIAGVLIAVFKLGIVGLCLGFITGRLVLSLSYPWIVGRFLGISLMEQFTSTIRPMLVMVLLFALALGARKFLLANTWPSLVLSVGLTLAIVLPLAFYLGLYTNQRQIIWQRVYNALPISR